MTDMIERVARALQERNGGHWEEYTGDAIADLRAELADLKTALAEADSKNAALSHEWNKCEAEIAQLRTALQSSLDQLDWINTQAENAMATSSGAATASGDSDGSLEMLNSIASDIGISAMMIRDKLRAALNPQPKTEESR